MCVHRETGGRGERNWECDGSICSLAIMREGDDNIFLVNWYRLTKYPDQEERGGRPFMPLHHVCSELHCDYLIHFNTDVLTAARPLPQTSFSIQYAPTLPVHRHLSVTFSRKDNFYCATIIFVLHAFWGVIYHLPAEWRNTGYILMRTTERNKHNHRLTSSYIKVLWGF